MGVVAEQMKVLTETLREDVSASFQADTWNAEARTMDIAWYTGATVARHPWFGDPYDLTFDMSDEAADLSRANKSAGVFIEHWTSAFNQLGVIEPGTARIEDGRGIATVRFSRREEFAGYVGDIVDRIINNFSMGVHIKSRNIEERKNAPDLHTATSWELREISIVGVAADPDAESLSAEPPQSENLMNKPAARPAGAAPANPAAATAAPVDEAALRAQLRAELEPKIKAELAAELSPELKAQLGEQLSARNVATKARAQLLGVADDKVTELLSDVSLSESELVTKLFEAAAKADESLGMSPRIAMRGNNESAFRLAVSDAIMVREGYLGEAEAHDGARQFVAFDFMGLATLCLERDGVSLSQMTRSQIAERAIQHLSMHSTSDFGNIISNTSNRSAVAGYESEPRTFLTLGRRTDLRNFQEVTRVRRGQLSSLIEVKEGEEYKHGTMGDGAESWGLLKSGRLFEITWEALLADDLNLLTGTPFDYGALASSRESDMFYDRLLGATKMSDDKVLFHSDHANLIASGDGGPPSTPAEINKTLLKLRRQTGIDDERISIMPRTILTPTGLAFGLDQLMSDRYTPNASGNVVTPRMRQLSIIDEIRLDDFEDGEPWFVFADSRRSGLEYGYLQGEPGVRVIRTQSGNRDGVCFKVRSVFGVGVVDHRGVVKNRGK